MIPISLSLQGIYSFQGKQTIDFTRLTSAGIFGIFGPVGSGKSTIIEAITYALYGRTDRLNLSGDNRNYNMMNLKSNDLLIEFIFKAGAGHEEYMIIVRSRRNSKQFEEVKSMDRTAYKMLNSEWVPIGVDAIENIIGLSYDNFKRTVIIPQGKFQEFLLLGNKERTQMMKELFNLDKYELYYKVVSLETKTNQQRQIIEGQLQQIGEITPEEITSRELSLVQVKKENEINAQQLLIKQNEEVRLRNLKDLVAKAAALKVQIETLKQREGEFNLLEKNIAAFEYCSINFRSLFDASRTSTHKIKRLTDDILADDTLLKTITSQLTELETAFEVIKLQYEGREKLKQEAGELDKIIRIHELDKNSIQLKERILKGEKAYQETLLSLETLKQQQETVISEIKNLKVQLPDMAVLSKVKDWFTVQNMLVSAHNDSEAEIIMGLQGLEYTVHQKTSLYTRECFEGIQVTDTFDVVVGLLEEKKTKHKSAIEVLDQEIQHNLVQLKLSEYATNLQDGVPCPVCGSLSHPLKYNSQNISVSLQNARNTRATHEKAISDIDFGMKKLTEIETSSRLKEDAFRIILQKEKEQQSKLTAHLELFCWEQFKDEKTVSEAFADAEKLQTGIAQKEGELEKLRLQFENANAQKDKFYKAIEDLRSSVTQITTESVTLKNQLQLLQLITFESSTSEYLSEEKNNRLQQYTKIETQYQTSVTKIELLRKEHHTLSGKLAVNRNSLEEELASKLKLDNDISNQLNNSEYNTIEQVELVLSWKPDLDKERKKLSDYRQSLDFSLKQLKSFQDEIADAPFDEAYYNELLATITKLSEEIKFKNQYQGKLEAELKELKSNIEKRTKLLEFSASLELRLEDIKTLKQLFKASGFVNYISSVYLRELCHSANERFYKLSGQKLRLEVSDDNNFEVRDFMNGGKLRNIKTLSGGQTFQAALSLALALADNTRKISGLDENFFFLDEGFGSLDRESLEVVFDTLKSLRRENRIVGIISHVEDMQQEIDVHLSVRNLEETGSNIEASWQS